MKSYGEKIKNFDKFPIIILLSTHFPPELSALIFEYLFIKFKDLAYATHPIKSSVLIGSDEKNLSITDLREEQFAELKILNMNFSAALAHQSHWEKITLHDVNISSTHFVDAHFVQTNFEQAFCLSDYPVNFSGSCLEAVGFYRASLPQADFTQSICKEIVKFQRCDLTKCDFTGADFSGVEFKNSNLSDAIFFRTNLLGAKFENTQLKNTLLVKFPSIFLQYLSSNSNAYHLLVSLLKNYLGSNFFKRAFNRLNKPYYQDIDKLLLVEEKEQASCEQAKILVNVKERYLCLYPPLQDLLEKKPVEEEEPSLKQCLNFTRLFTNHSQWYDDKEESKEQAGFCLR